MKQQKKQLLILIGVLIAVLAVYLLLRSHNGAGGEVNDGEFESTALVNMDGLTGLSYTDENGQVLEFHKREGTWFHSDWPELILDQEQFSAIEKTLSNLHYQRRLTEYDTLDGYGLEPAVRVVTGTSDQGDVCTIRLGNEINYESIYYAMVDDRDGVYVISGDLFAATDYGLMDLVEVESLPELNQENIKSISVASADGTLQLNKLTEKKQQVQQQETGTTDENGAAIMEDVTVTVEVYRWSLANGRSISTDNETLLAVLDDLSSLNFVCAADYRPTEEQIKEYAFGTTITVECIDGTQTVLQIGGVNEVGTQCYARLNASNLIYYMSVSAIDSLLMMSTESLLT